MKYYIIAGEASGDLHGSNLIKEIVKNDPNCEFRIWGGDLMSKAANTSLVKHYKTYDHMGFVEVVKHLKTILNNMEFCKTDIAEYKPDAIIFVDFPGFNLKIAPFAKSLGIKTFFYISPTVWAWKENRVKNIKANVDHMFVELPFVKEFYESKHNYKVDFVGHPLLDSIAQFTEKHTLESFIEANNLPNKKIIAVLPGSREYEIRENLKTMQAFSEDFSEHEFVIAGMSRFSKEFYEQYITAKNISIIFDQTYELIKKADAAIVVSGTATLETAILGTPQVIVYRTNPITYALIKILVRLKYSGLPNLILKKEIVPEFLQRRVTPKNIKNALKDIVYNPKKRLEIAESYKTLYTKLGKTGASKRTAQHIVNYLKK